MGASVSELFEICPFTFGVLLGLTWLRFDGPGKRRLSWAATCVALGAFATFASGEWREGPLFLVFDVSLVALVSAAVALATTYSRLRRST
jgi:hypothetical protein